MKKLLCLLIIGTFLSFAHAAQSSVKLSNNAQKLFNSLNEPQNKNDSFNDPQSQNETELLMFTLKSLEDKKITDKNKKIEFVNSLKIDSDIKQFVINQINQNLNFSDFEKVSYGVYINNKCNDDFQKDIKQQAQQCWVDQGPNRGNCAPQRSNVCCKG
jgi:hypothetical protein